MNKTSDKSRNKLSKFGLHIKWYDSIKEVLELSDNLDLDCFQFFLFNYKCKYKNINDSLRNKDILYKFDHASKFKKIYVHASFCINFSDPRRQEQILLEKELKIATKLQCKYYILHPGAVPKNFTKTDGINSVANIINIYSKKFPHIVFVLENMSHRGRSVGGSLEELKLILDNIENKDKVKICIDTAHAFVYGYDINTKTGCADFIKQISTLFNKNNIELVHLNNTKEALGSQHDCHSLLSDGTINIESLKYLIKDPIFSNSVKLLELPDISNILINKELDLVKDWFKKN